MPCPMLQNSIKSLHSDLYDSIKRHIVQVVTFRKTTATYLHFTAMLSGEDSTMRRLLETRISSVIAETKDLSR